MKTYNFKGHRIQSLRMDADNDLHLTLTVARGSEYNWDHQETLHLHFCEWAISDLLQRYAEARNKQLQDAFRYHEWAQDRIDVARSAFAETPKATP